MNKLLLLLLCTSLILSCGQNKENSKDPKENLVEKIIVQYQEFLMMLQYV